MGKEFQQKRRIQIALRRYIMVGYPATHSAWAFGLSMQKMRQYIESHFSEGMGWSNFGKLWDLDHRIPVCYFDFNNKEDYQLCWNFLNIRPLIRPNNSNRSARLDVRDSVKFFMRVFNETGYDVAKKLADKSILISQQLSGDENMSSIIKMVSDNVTHINLFREQFSDSYEDEFSYLQEAFSKNVRIPNYNL